MAPPQQAPEAPAQAAAEAETTKRRREGEGEAARGKKRKVLKAVDTVDGLNAKLKREAWTRVLGLLKLITAEDVERELCLRPGKLFCVMARRPFA